MGAVSAAGPQPRGANSIASASVDDAQLAYLSTLGNLERLDLSATETGDLGFASFKTLSTLPELIINNTTVPDVALA